MSFRSQVPIEIYATILRQLNILPEAEIQEKIIGPALTASDFYKKITNNDDDTFTDIQKGITLSVWENNDIFWEKLQEKGSDPKAVENFLKASFPQSFDNPPQEEKQDEEKKEAKQDDEDDDEKKEAKQDDEEDDDEEDDDDDDDEDDDDDDIPYKESTELKQINQLVKKCGRIRLTAEEERKEISKFEKKYKLTINDYVLNFRKRLRKKQSFPFMLQKIIDIRWNYMLQTLQVQTTKDLIFDLEFDLLMKWPFKVPKDVDVKKYLNDKKVIAQFYKWTEEHYIPPGKRKSQGETNDEILRQKHKMAKKLVFRKFQVSENQLRMTRIKDNIFRVMRIWKYGNRKFPRIERIRLFDTNYDDQFYIYCPTKPKHQIFVSEVIGAQPLPIIKSKNARDYWNKKKTLTRHKKWAEAINMDVFDLDRREWRKQTGKREWVKDPQIPIDKAKIDYDTLFQQQNMAGFVDDDQSYSDDNRPYWN